MRAHFGARDHPAGDQCYEKLVLGRLLVPVRCISYSGVRSLLPLSVRQLADVALRQGSSHPELVVHPAGASSLDKSGSKLPHSKVTASGLEAPISLRRGISMERRSTLRKFRLAVAGLLALVLLYYAGTMLQAYLVTPRLIARITHSDRMVLRPEQFPSGWLQALLTVEDPHFYTHDGIDLSTPGITTITQALVKLYYFHPFKPGIAKLRQSLIALVLDRRVDKQTQLRIFVNSVYMGNCRGKQIYGLSDAAQAYFGKPFSRLTRDEYLSLVAMIVGPNGFNVRTQPAENAARARRIKRLLAGECRPRDNGDVLLEDCG
jgi:transglycosylase-like protein